MIVYKRGSGYHHKRMKKCNGSGILDSIVDFISNNKDMLKQVGEAAINTVKVGKNTRQIVNAIKNDLKPRDLTVNESLAYDHIDLKNIINRINKLKFGEGFGYT